jgi:hypothetical protein
MSKMAETRLLSFIFWITQFIRKNITNQYTSYFLLAQVQRVLFAGKACD